MFCLFGAFAESSERIVIKERGNDFCCMTVQTYGDGCYFIVLETTDKECFMFSRTRNLKDCMICFHEEWPKFNNPDIRDKVLQYYRESSIRVDYLKEGIVAYLLK